MQPTCYLVVEVAEVVYLQMVDPVCRGGMRDFLEACGFIETAQSDRQDDFGSRFSQVLARHPDVGEASLAPECGLALGDTHLERPVPTDYRAHLRERRQRIRVTREELLRRCTPTCSHTLMVACIGDIRIWLEGCDLAELADYSVLSTRVGGAVLASMVWWIVAISHSTTMAVMTTARPASLSATSINSPPMAAPRPIREVTVM